MSAGERDPNERPLTFTQRLQIESRGNPFQRQKQSRAEQRLFGSREPLRDENGRFISPESQPAASFDGGARAVDFVRPSDRQRVQEAISTLMELTGPYVRDPYAPPFAGVKLSND